MFELSRSTEVIDNMNFAISRHSIVTAGATSTSVDAAHVVGHGVVMKE